MIFFCFFLAKKPESAKKVEEPVKKAEEPAPQVEEPVKKAEEPVKKVEEPVKKAEKLTKNSKEPENGVKKDEKVEKELVYPQGDCAVCDKLAKNFCSICKHVFYCSTKCQRQHWPTHKEDCKTLAKLPYRIERNEKLGRFLVAQTDLQPGQLIFNELPMIVGPRQLTKPICLGKCTIVLRSRGLVSQLRKRL